MRVSSKLVLISIPIIILFSGCKSTESPITPQATTQIPQTNTSIPPTQTLTPFPPTLTSIPPTDTPTLTETASPSATLVPDTMVWPTAESFFEGVRVTSFNNAGFIIVVGDTKILIDVLYDIYPARTAPEREVLERAVKAQPPFDQADLVIATHAHIDHFSADLVRDYLRRSPESVFISSPEAVRQINTLGREFDERLISVSLAPGESRKLSVKDIALEIFYITHGDVSILNLGFAITVDGITLFHSGDMNTDSRAGDAVSLADLQSYGIPEKQIDIAFLPSSIFYTEEYRPLIDQGIQASYLVPMHFSFRSPPDEILESFSNAIVFKNTLESWIMPQANFFPEN